MRIREYEYLRDLMKKLMYSLEQVNMQQIERKGLDVVALSANEEQTHVQGEVNSPARPTAKLPDLQTNDIKR